MRVRDWLGSIRLSDHSSREVTCLVHSFVRVFLDHAQLLMTEPQPLPWEVKFLNGARVREFLLWLRDLVLGDHNRVVLLRSRKVGWAWAAIVLLPTSGPWQFIFTFYGCPLTWFQLYIVLSVSVESDPTRRLLLFSLRISFEWAFWGLNLLRWNFTGPVQLLW